MFRARPFEEHLKRRERLRFRRAQIDCDDAIAILERALQGLRCRTRTAIAQKAHDQVRRDVERRSTDRKSTEDTLDRNFERHTTLDVYLRFEGNLNVTN